MKNNPPTKENQHDSASLMEGILKNLFLFIISIAVVGVQAVFAAKQTVAVLPSEGILKDEELIFFTDKAQEIAVQALPKSSFEVFPRDVIIKRLDGVDNYIKECKKSSCIVELGKKAMVDYIAQCSFGKLGSDFTVTFELYKVSTEGLIDKFVDKAKNTDGLSAIMEKRIPDGFMKIPGASPVVGEINKPQTISPSSATDGMFTDNSLRKCHNGSYVNSQGNTVCRPSSKASKTFDEVDTELDDYESEDEEPPPPKKTEKKKIEVGETEKSVSFGVRVNGGTAGVSSSNETIEGGNTYGLGAYALIPILGIYFVPEIAIQHREPIKDFYGLTVAETAIDVPLLFRFRYREENLIYLGIGPYFGVVLDLQDSYDGTFKNHRSKSDIGFTCELGFRIDEHFSIDIRYLGSFSSFGIEEYLKIVDNTQNLVQAQIGVNYAF